MRRPIKSSSKLKNEAKIVDGIKFHSIAESRRYSFLKLMEKAGLIECFTLQPKFELVPKLLNHRHELKTFKEKNLRAMHYQADFMYVRTSDRQIIIEDYKGFPTDHYKVKLKMFLSIINDDTIFREVTKPNQTV